MTNYKVVLRDESGAHICAVTDVVQMERLERRARAGEVILSRKMKRGHLTLIFRLKAAAAAPVEPSQSKPDEAELTDWDMKALAGVEVLTTRTLARLMGHGIRPSRHRQRSGYNL